ncbi:MAG: O-antigen ligase family protein, partial [Terrimicrobiaceae bacterium]|nr:O-antigen ligase family protein [Terrimicrobiaceae bacterium]
MEWLATVVILLPAVWLFVIRSSWLMDYLVWVTVLNRGIRRYVDWLAGAFNAFSPISLTPLIISGLLFVMVMQNFGAFPRNFQTVLKLFGVALGLAFVVGVVRNQLAAVYALAEYLAPVAIMGCAVMAGGREQLLDRWVKTVGWAAVAASLYGWYQYYTIPPWDAFWVKEVGFVGYLGQLRPTEMTVFSTMAERGPLAGFLAFAVIPMIVSKRWRNAGGWFSVALIISAMLLTYVRSAVITVALAVVLFPLLNRGKNTLRIIFLLCLLAVGANFGLSRIPSSNRIGERLSSLGSITEDGSFKGRLNIAAYGLGQVLGNPLGTGLGSTGLAGRVNTGEIEAGASIGDNGYFAILFSLGWIGAACFFGAFALIWR